MFLTALCGSTGFQSTLPVWGATAIKLPIRHSLFDFNPRSPYGERPHFARGGLSEIYISIHAPRVGSDLRSVNGQMLIWHFNPRSPCGERPADCGVYKQDHHFNPRSPCGERLCYAKRLNLTRDFNPRSPCGERRQNLLRIISNREFISIHAPRVGSDIRNTTFRKLDIVFQSTLPVWGATAKMHRFFFCIFGKKGIFCDILQIGRHLQGIGRKRWGDFLSRSVRTSRGKYGYLAFAFRESGGLRENRRFYSQSVLFSFRIDCQGSRILGCPFRGP